MLQNKYYIYGGIALLALILVIGIVIMNRQKPVPVEPVVPVVVSQPVVATIGTSVHGREIQSYTYGTGSTTLLFVGGIHGGYEWNSTLLAYEFIDHIKNNPEIIPQNTTVIVVPTANPDGLYKVLGKEGRFTLSDVPADEGPLGNGRFNANNVDLNRNFDCKWKPTSSWRGNTVSAGTSAFSEPEARAIRDLVLAQKPKAAIFWHSQANAVYASECENGILPETLALMNAYANAANYTAVQSFDAYPVSGDAEGWLASIGIPAITVELQTHKTVEWERNLRGIRALFDYYREK